MVESGEQKVSISPMLSVSTSLLQFISFADASMTQSVFPSCSGYNPMQTTMAVAHSIARFVQEDLVVAAQKENRANL